MLEKCYRAIELSCVLLITAPILALGYACAKPPNEPKDPPPDILDARAD